MLLSKNTLLARLLKKATLNLSPEMELNSENSLEKHSQAEMLSRANTTTGT